jgi:hypothetical protein
VAKSISSTPRRFKDKKRPRGRPRTHQEQWVKVSVVLFERQIVDLDSYVTDIRRHNGNVLNRAGLIRAVIDAFLNSAIDRRAIQSEAGLRALVTRRLKS